jgi:hypothetical protein
MCQVLQMDKDVIIFVDAVRPATFEALKEYEAQTGRRFEPVVLVDEKIKDSIFENDGQNHLPEAVKVVSADFDSANSLRLALRPYDGRIFAITAQYENCLQELLRLIPYVPYMSMPTETSLIWSTEKNLMRKMMEAYDPSLVPGYLEVPDAGLVTIERVEATLSYPMVVKPSGLGGSLLVSYVKSRQELEQTLRRTFSSMQDVYDMEVKRQKPAVVVEEFMEGDMYTIDVYVDALGNCSYTPAVLDVVGRKVGYDDFFVYRDFLPSGLAVDDEESARRTAGSACRALNLRSVTAHVELMRTVNGWKIIELGPRIGGDRHELLWQAYGINHIMNDIRNRAGEKPDIPNELQKSIAIYWLYPRREGTLKEIYGLEEVKQLASFVDARYPMRPGQPVLFAKNGGDRVLDIILSHTDRAQLEKDMAAMEATIKFDVE